MPGAGHHDLVPKSLQVNTANANLDHFIRKFRPKRFHQIDPRKIYIAADASLQLEGFYKEVSQSLSYKECCSNDFCSNESCSIDLIYNECCWKDFLLMEFMPRIIPLHERTLIILL
jgi:hypothetical protein